MIEEFNFIYELKIQGNDGSPLYSGLLGMRSELEFNSHDYVHEKCKYINTICDLGCGYERLKQPKFDI